MPEVAVVMPKMSMTMTDGEVLSWNKKAGDTVGAGDVVCEVLTDKVDMEVESPVSGILIRVVASVGDQIAVGEPLAFIDSSTGGLLDGLLGAASQPAASQPPGAEQQAAEPELALTTTPPSRKARVPALPGARRRAGELGVDLLTLSGTGPGGAVAVVDVERAASMTASNHRAPAPRPQPGRAVTEAVTQPSEQTLTGRPAEPEAESSLDDPSFATALRARKNALRKAVARAMKASTEIPQFTVWSELDLGEANRLRERISWTTVLLGAFSRALAFHPLGQDTVGRVAVALAVDTPIGLLGPVIHGADTKSLQEIDADVRMLARRARAGELTGSELAGATTTFSNLGGWGIADFNALLTPGQASALSAGAVTERPVVRNGGLTVALTCRVGLTVDHCQADGADAARLLEQLNLILTRGVTDLFGNRAGVGSR